ncbi:DUF6777 domain-containing protein [Gordonia bronchialis]|uniref:DUF6777 domain-containing protein n=1 Tax=Gordonia bronchialis TaxID=2054 RepID=UPI00242C0671|nr:DUF6777 domain-containing protein [Gordonia bronchialis]
MSYYPPGPPTAPSGAFTTTGGTPRNRRALTFVLAAIVVVLALILAAGVVLVVKARNGDIKIPGLTLTAADDRGIDPFTDSVALAEPSALENVRLSAQVGYPQQGTVLVNGSDPGLYATTGSASCDANRLSRQLTSDPGAASAWASVFGISSASIPYYLNTLTPVVLTRDTWVTDHSYTNGKAQPYQAVLQAGTCVMVDAAGVPRVRCAGGSPLAPPAAAPVGGYRLEGRQWPGYQTNKVTRVSYQDKHVTTVNNTTTVVPGPGTPVAGDPRNPILQLLNAITGAITPAPLGGDVNLSGLPPLGEPLPNPVTTNIPFVPRDQQQADANGLARAGSPQVAAEVTERAADNNGVPEGAPASETSSAVQSAPQVSGSTEAVPSTEASTVVPPPSTEAAPTATSFSGSGDRIGSFSFQQGATSVNCSVPATDTGPLLSLSCSDGARTVPASILSRSAISAATDAQGVWRLSLRSGVVAVTSATWVQVATSTTTTTETPTTTTTTEAPTTETPTTTETTTEETTTTTTTETTTEETTTTTTEEVPTTAPVS